MRWGWFLLPVLAMGPFERNHPLVDDGEAAFEKGDYDGALQKFDAADKQLPNNASIAFNRGAALHKLGRNEEARQAFFKASELNQGKQPLQSKIHYNLGNAWAATSNKKEAVAEYRKALRLDPADENARHNLEVLLKDLQPPKQNGPDGGTPDGGKSDGGKGDAGSGDGGKQDSGTPQDGGAGDGGQGDGGADGGDGGQQGGDGGQGDGGTQDGGAGEGQQRADGGSEGNQKADGGSDAGSATDGGSQGDEGEAEMTDGGSEMSRKEAERMLDAMKNTERNLQLWRFRPGDKDKKRKQNEKDW